MRSAFDLSGVQLWPTMLFNRQWEQFDDYVEELESYLYEVRDNAKTRIASGVAIGAKSMEGLFESDFDLFEHPNPAIQALRTWIEATVKSAVSLANGGTIPPDQLEVEFTEAWCHITNEGGFHDAHYHDNCSWCGIFYVRAADCRPSDASGAGNGISRFYCPIGVGGMAVDFGSQYLSQNRVDFTPSDGKVVLFPSFLLHSGLPYKGENDRILIAFNTKTRVKE